MAIAIKSIPILQNKDASSFIKKANTSFAKRGTVDYSQQVKNARAILSKAKV